MTQLCCNPICPKGAYPAGHPLCGFCCGKCVFLVFSWDDFDLVGRGHLWYKPREKGHYRHCKNPTPTEGRAERPVLTTALADEIFAFLNNWEAEETSATQTSMPAGATELPYGQAWDTGRGLVQFTHDANPRSWYEAWGPEQVAREWPAGRCRLQLSELNVFYTAPPPNGTKLRAHDLFVDTSLVVTVEESGFVEDFRDSKWIWVRFACGTAAVWTNVVREPNRPRNHRFPWHYTNRHTQWGTRMMPPLLGNEVYGITAAGLATEHRDDGTPRERSPRR